MAISQNLPYTAYSSNLKNIVHTKSTLDILCQFMGYKDSIEFIEKLAESRQKLHFSGINTIPSKSNGLLFYCIENTAKSPLIDFFGKQTSSITHLRPM